MRVFSKTAFIVLFTFICLESAAAQPARAKNGMIASECSMATNVGLEILKMGGNAVDAAVAVGFALAVTYPEAGNIGGGGFSVIHLSDGKSTSIDYREKAPLKAHSEMFLDEEGNFDITLSTRGWTSSGVPGSVAGLIYTLEKYGTMNLKEIIQPAIDLAENGFILDYYTANLLKAYNHHFNRYESTKKIFTKNGEPFEEGELLIQKDLAETLRLILNEGKDGFYKGRTAKLLAEQSQNNGGYITEEDLNNYSAIEKEPVRSTYRGRKIISMGPSSSGGIALTQALNVFENFSFSYDDWGGGKYVHTLSEILKYVYADRAKHLGDDEFYDVPKKRLTSKDYAKSISERIGEAAVPSVSVMPGVLYEESENTTHYAVVDKYGNAVSTTTTINSLFGNKIVVDGAGFFMNNEMDDFSSKPGEPNQFGLIGYEANSIQPGKRMLSAMTPTIILDNEKPLLIVGARGGSRIITAVLQTIINTLDFGMNIQEAMDRPRIHQQWMPDSIDYEKFGLPEDVRDNLIKRGHNIGSIYNIGKVVGIKIENGIFTGGVDSRGSGLAAGY